VDDKRFHGVMLMSWTLTHTRFLGQETTFSTHSYNSQGETTRFF